MRSPCRRGCAWSRGCEPTSRRRLRSSVSSVPRPPASGGWTCSSTTPACSRTTCSNTSPARVPAHPRGERRRRLPLHQGCRGPDARQGEGGSIINITSIDAVHPSGAGLSHYGTSKHAIWGLTKTMALELGPDGIRVNAVAPGPVADGGRGRVRRGGRPGGHRRRGAVGGLCGADPAEAARRSRRRCAGHPVPCLGARGLRQRGADRGRRRPARGMTSRRRAVPGVPARPADGRQPARVASRLDAGQPTGPWRCSTRSPTGSRFPSTRTARSGGSSSRGRSSSRSAARREPTAAAIRTSCRTRFPHRAVIHPGFVGIDVFADADRYRPRDGT